MLKSEMIFVNPAVKCSVATWLMTDLCVNVHKTIRLSECIYAVGYFKKENLKDGKRGIRESQ